VACDGSPETLAIIAVASLLAFLTTETDSGETLCDCRPDRPSKVTSGGQSDEDRRYVAPTILYPVSWSNPGAMAAVPGKLTTGLKGRAWQSSDFWEKLEPKSLSDASKWWLRFAK